MNITDEQITRYSPDISLPEAGGKGQKKIAQARILIVGANGLGSPVVLYLARGQDRGNRSLEIDLGHRMPLDRSNAGFGRAQYGIARDLRQMRSPHALSAGTIRPSQS